MIIGFMGAPSTGKTTLALALATRLKEQGFPVEFVPEYARQYILEKKNKIHLEGLLEFKGLDKTDQFNIKVFVENQLSVFNNVGKSIFICDGAIINNCFYSKEKPRIDDVFWYDIIFYSKNIFGLLLSEFDSNRIHNKEQIAEIHHEMENFISSNEKDFNITTVQEEDLEERVDFCYREMMKKIAKLHFKQKGNEND